ncbi:hypothetical protein C922_05763, partial [Plasmodium inui San Antonio 1]
INIFGLNIDDEAASFYGSMAPSVYENEALSLYGSEAPNVYESETLSVYGSEAPNVYESETLSVYGSEASSIYESDNESIMGDPYSSSDNINEDDSTVTLFKNQYTRDFAYGSQEGSSNINNDPEDDSPCEIMNITAGEAISEESTDDDDSSHSKNEEHLTEHMISDLVNSLNETVHISEMIQIFNLMMTLERKKI